MVRPSPSRGALWVLANSDEPTGSPVARVQLAAISFIQSPDTSERDETDTIARAARDFGSWRDAHRLEKESGVYVNGSRLADDPANVPRNVQPQWAEGKSWAWCLWEAAIDLPTDAETFSLVARVGESLFEVRLRP